MRNELRIRMRNNMLKYNGVELDPRLDALYPTIALTLAEYILELINNEENTKQ